MPTISRPDMNEYILILSVLYNANKNEIHGQTRFQKLVYKIQRKINTEDCIYTYKFNEYDTGMFSRDLQRTLKNVNMMV